MAKMEVLIKIANLGSEGQEDDKEGKSLARSWPSRRKIVW